MKELMSYKYVGPKSAFVVMGWCLKRNRFTVDTHVYRIAGLWGWRPKEADAREDATAFGCACRGGAKKDQKCKVSKEIRKIA
ncbi:hypothetical protein SNOG_14621 [Parastagonospora nodorum SN15]|uniref:HhH-GPD domain-containing protein n=1 Tax=Phaeosphaeria nodorum (strain SN15 / ATCC MYA-4574 / FGSC 10173) TaxID=321614 RepID=Q0U0B0_PHANO|nr:hypothetical protein SNOG_14621 [Parastagonospora nodorum SN15]EAT77813.1 hypothetical protein SNOG_14621 [Parastagonospora nodorum SN15]